MMALLAENGPCTVNKNLTTTINCNNTLANDNHTTTDNRFWTFRGNLECAGVFGRLDAADGKHEIMLARLRSEKHKVRIHFWPLAFCM